jgi:hypothetical protein
VQSALEKRVVASAGDTTEVSAAARRQVDSTAVVLAPAGPTPRPGQPAPLTRPPPAAATAAGPAQQVSPSGAAPAPRPGCLREKLVKEGPRLLVSEIVPADSGTTLRTRPYMATPRLEVEAPPLCMLASLRPMWWGVGEPDSHVWVCRSTWPPGLPPPRPPWPTGTLPLGRTSWGTCWPRTRRPPTPTHHRR